MEIQWGKKVKWKWKKVRWKSKEGKMEIKRMWDGNEKEGEMEIENKVRWKKESEMEIKKCEMKIIRRWLGNPKESNMKIQKCVRWKSAGNLFSSSGSNSSAPLSLYGFCAEKGSSIVTWSMTIGHRHSHCDKINLDLVNTETHITNT